jgi:hypothetical protein
MKEKQEHLAAYLVALHHSRGGGLTVADLAALSRLGAAFAALRLVDVLEEARRLSQLSEVGR